METMLIREFRADHQRITGALLRLRRAIEQCDVSGVRSILAGADTLLGAHFKFEEHHLYPALTGFIGVDGVRQMVREHDDIFESVGRLMALSRQSVWADPERTAALESFGLVGEHPEHCDDLCRYVEQLPAMQQDTLLEQMQTIRRERPEFSAYAIVRRSADGTSLRDR